MRLYFDNVPRGMAAKQGPHMLGAPSFPVVGMLAPTNQRGMGALPPARRRVYVKPSRTYVVQPGDTMLSIAARAGLAPAVLLALNPKKRKRGARGELVILPPVVGETLNLAGVITSKLKSQRLGDDEEDYEDGGEDDYDMPGTCGDGFSYSWSKLKCIFDAQGTGCQGDGVYDEDGVCVRPGVPPPGGGGGVPVGTPCTYVDPQTNLIFYGTTDANGECINLSQPYKQGQPQSSAECEQKYGPGFIYNPFTFECVKCGPNTTQNPNDGYCDCLPGYVPVGGEGQGCKPAGGGGGTPPGGGGTPPGGGGTPPGGGGTPPGGTTTTGGGEKKSSALPWVLGGVAALVGGVIIAKQMKKKKS